MKISHVIKHKPYQANNAGLNTYPPSASNAGPDEFSPENIGSSAVKFAKNKGLQSAMRFMVELNVNDIKRQSKSQNDSMLNLSDGTGLLLAFDQKIYQANDDYVSKAGLRQELTKTLQKQHPHEKICWLESVGVAEAGDGFYATVPVFNSHGASVGLGFGFSAGIILRYRRSQAIVGHEPHQVLKALKKTQCLPFTPMAARMMEAGQEFELCGQGKLRCDAGFAARYGVGEGIAVAGVQVGLGAMAAAAVEYSINVMAIDGLDIVRVTIRQIHQESTAISASALAGLIIPGNAIWRGNFGLPQVGHGLLKYMVEHRGNANVESYLSDYTTLSLNGSLSHQDKATHICSYDIDLSNEEAAEAYAALMRLDARPASALAQANKGVVKVEFKEKQHINKASLRLALCAEKLFLVEALKSQAQGELIDNQGSHKIYRDRTYKKHKENWLTGQSDALWEAVEIKKNQEDPKSYYHFNYRKCDSFTRQAEIDHFFRFADSLGIKEGEHRHIEVVKMHSMQKLLSSADDCEVNVDLYFNASGVERIRASSAEEIAQAYLNTRAELDNNLAKHPSLSDNQGHKEQGELIFALYRMARHSSPLSPKRHQSMKRLHSEYFHSFGRKLKHDYTIFRQAQDFAELTRGLVALEQDRQKIGQFFAALGKGGTPHYTRVIPTLAKLAGRDNVLVHTLSAFGGGVELKSTDEGALVHPRNELVKICLRPAS